MAEIVITEFMDQAAVDSLSDDFDVVYVPQSCDRPDELPGLLADARALIVRNRTQVRGSLLAAAPGLEVVGRLGVGLDNIDLAACRERAIEVFPATGANDLAVAEYVIAAVMILLRGAYHSFEAMLEGTWPRTALMGREITGKRLGLLGFGRIAREVAWRGTALGMEIAAFDPFVPAQDAAWQTAQRLDL
ncbi:MAG: 3-phosphoglycerate dehydrogenase, partial [Gammaproteobacteria bacterium]|nr:3-phosphoglycerate dehydrogenase [Gammaproteobacteria bacterium]